MTDININPAIVVIMAVGAFAVAAIYLGLVVVRKITDFLEETADINDHKDN